MSATECNSVERKCVDCGAELFRSKNQGRWPVRCPSCNSDKYPSAVVHEARACAECGQVYVPKRMPRGDGYCSRQCKGRASNRRNCVSNAYKLKQKRMDAEWRAKEAERARKQRALGIGPEYGRAYRARLKERAAVGDADALAVIERARELARVSDRKRDVRQRNAANRARRRKCIGSYNKRDLNAQMARQKHRCYWCGVKVKGNRYHADHVIPLSLGGTNWASNIVIACPHCNQVKGAKHPMEFAGVLC